MLSVLELVNLNLLIKSVHYELNIMTNNAAFDIKTKKYFKTTLIVIVVVIFEYFR